MAIVNWNTRDYLRTCLRSLEEAAPEECEITVVDNASADGSAEMVAGEFPRVRLIWNNNNLGYAAANNQAIRASDSEYIMLLNPDAWPMKGCLEALAHFLDANPRAAAAAPRLLNPDGSLQQSVRSLPYPLSPAFRRSGPGARLPGQPLFRGIPDDVVGSLRGARN